MRYVFVVLALMLMVGCGGGGGGPECTFTSLTTPTYDLDGQMWNLSGDTPTNNCPDPNYTFYVDGTFSQNGNTISVSGEGITLTGQISGNQIIWGGTITLGDETLRVECTTMNITGVDVGDTMTFSNTNWTVDYGSGTCSGTASGTFTRIS